MKLQQEYQKMINTICLSPVYPHKHFQAANELIVKRANAGQDSNLLSEILFQLTEGYQDIGNRSAGERMRDILKWHTTEYF